MVTVLRGLCELPYSFSQRIPTVGTNVTAVLERDAQLIGRKVRI